MTDFVVYRLKEAGWIAGHRFEKDCGYLLDWTMRGRQQALLLQELIASHQLDKGSHARKFAAACKAGQADWEANPITPVERDFWLLCLDELGIGAEENSLGTLARVLASWEHP